MRDPIWTDVSADADKPFVGAHRGASAVAAENTAAAFEAAISAGADFIETDLRLTRDGIPVAFHDPDLRRLCGDLRTVAELDLSELRALHPALVTIAEAIDLIAGRSSILLDTKIQKPLELRHSADILASRLADSRVAFGVRSLETLEIVHQCLPEAPKLGLFAQISDYPELAKRGGAWVRLWEPDASQEAIAALQVLGLKVVIMTGKPADGSVGLIETDALDALFSRKPEAVMLNDPALALALRERRL